MKLITNQIPDTFYNYKIVSKYGDFEFNLKDELFFDDQTIDQALQRYSTTLFVLNKFCEEAQLELNILTDTKERLYNNLYSAFKQNKGEDGKYLSDTRIERLIGFQDSYCELQSTIRQKEFEYKSLRNLVSVFENHLKAMQTYASNRRKELNALSYTT